MSYQKYYPNGWQSGESGNTPITPDALNHIENGIANSAPGGFGLGVGIPTTARSLEELDNFTLSGNYRLSMGWTKVNNVDVANASIRVDTVIDDGSVRECMQTMKPLGSNTILLRHLVGGAFSPWECVAGTQPMALGVEYRTTERRNGKPVYTIMLSAGAMTSVNDISVPVPGITEMLRFAMTLGDDICTELNSSAIGGDPVNKFFCLPTRYYNKVGLYVVCGDTHVGKELIVQIWYTKG